MQLTSSPFQLAALAMGSRQAPGLSCWSHNFLLQQERPNAVTEDSHCLVMRMVSGDVGSFPSG